MKKILLILALTYSLFAGECILISSPYTNKIENIKESSFYGQHYYTSYKSEGKYKFRDFSEAYVLFVNALSENAKQHCKEKGYTGVYNVKVSHSVLEQKGYYFTGSVDYIKE